jgi:hypothetical protein
MLETLYHKQFSNISKGSLMSDPIQQSVLFPSLCSRPVHIGFDEPEMTTDGGALLLKAVDERLGLTERLAAAITDGREAGKVRHQLSELLQQRIFGLALGYPDGNDVGRIGGDPMFRMLVGRDPAKGNNLASQPTLSRFENTATHRDLYRMGETLAESVVEYHRHRLRRRRVRRITIDMDPTDTPTYGAQQLTFFNGHYDNYCYLPMLGFLTFDKEPDQYLFTSVLRSGQATAKLGAVAILRRVIALVCESFPGTTIRVRLDGGFACAEMFEFLDGADVEYLVGIGKNKVLERRSSRLMGTARRKSRERTETVALFGETSYAARSWKKNKRRVIYKAEVTRTEGREPRNNPRFVVTNMKLAPRNIYKIYRMRGESENRIKELLYDLGLARMSCSRFAANQMRSLLVAAAYVIMQTLRCRVSGTRLGRKQVGTLRLMLFKIGGKIRASVRRITIHLAENHPWREEWLLAAKAWRAIPA